jgi:hypothetical protein
MNLRTVTGVILLCAAPLLSSCRSAGPPAILARGEIVPESATIVPVVENDRYIAFGLIRVETLESADFRAHVIRRNGFAMEGLILIPDIATVVDVRLALTRLGLSYVDFPGELPSPTLEMFLPAVDGVPFRFDNDPLFERLVAIREQVRTNDQIVIIPGYGEAYSILMGAQITELIGNARRRASPR